MLTALRSVVSSVNWGHSCLAVGVPFKYLFGSAHNAHQVLGLTSSSISNRQCSSSSSSPPPNNYDPYPQIETPSPYKARRGNRRIHNAKIYTGGLLPRPEGEFENKPLPMPPWDPQKKDQWTAKKALFGQNDYIDILGDGTIHPWELISAPPWLKGYRGNELQRVSRQLAIEGSYLRETFPSKYHTLTKTLFYQFKRLNKRRNTPYWGAYRGRGRIDNPGRGR